MLGGSCIGVCDDSGAVSLIDIIDHDDDEQQQKQEHESDDNCSSSNTSSSSNKVRQLRRRAMVNGHSNVTNTLNVSRLIQPDVRSIFPCFAAFGFSFSVICERFV